MPLDALPHSALPPAVAVPFPASTPRLRETWPVHRRQALQLLAVSLAFIAIWSLIGLVLTHTLAGSRFVHADVSVSSWLARHRTSGWNNLTSIGSALADTTVKVVITAVLASAMLWRWKRWREPLMIVIPLVLEALCFITVTTVVGRPRPSMSLDSSPVNSSYPSGHTAAAVAYAAFVVVLFWHTPRRWVRVVAVVAAVAVVMFVGLSRLYRGMHYTTDIVMGGLLGGMSVIVAFLILRRSESP
ncbi:MAG: phosphatase PAP2 family protein [Actinomycetota bacterium]|nr:phosphatase PAP2 family protein [Actinomycetota bacterium]